MFDSIANGIDWTWARNIVFIAYGLTIVSIIVIVVSENRNPVKSLAWVTVLLLLPMVGIILYLFFGRNITNKHKLSRRNRRKLKKREAVSHADFRKFDLSPGSIQNIRLAKSMADAQFYDGNDVEVFTNGADKFARLKTDLVNARHYINLE